MYVYLFLILVIVSLPIFDSSFLKDSKMNNFILNNTPVLSSVSEEIIDIYGDVYNIIDNRKGKTNEQLNEEILKVLIDKKVVKEIVDTEGKSYTTPWFGQLMTGPQLIAYLIQLNIWLKEYDVNILM